MHECALSPQSHAQACVIMHCDACGIHACNRRPPAADGYVAHLQGLSMRRVVRQGVSSGCRCSSCQRTVCSSAGLLQKRMPSKITWSGCWPQAICLLQHDQPLDVCLVGTLTVGHANVQMRQGAEVATSILQSPASTCCFQWCLAASPDPLVPANQFCCCIAIAKHVRTTFITRVVEGAARASFWPTFDRKALDRALKQHHLLHIKHHSFTAVRQWIRRSIVPEHVNNAVITMLL